MSEEYNSKWLFPTGDGDRPTIEEFEKMVEEARTGRLLLMKSLRKRLMSG